MGADESKNDIEKFLLVNGTFPIIPILNQEIIKLINGLLKKNKKLAGYGASARSSTLLNYCKINDKHLDFVFDKSDMKHNLFTSGSNIQIRKPEIKTIKSVDCILILAWNFKDEIIKFLKKIKFSGILITVLPRIKIFKC